VGYRYAYEGELQEKRLQKLGDLAEKVEWDFNHRAMFEKKVRLLAEGFPTGIVPTDEAYNVTPQILSQEYGDFNVIPAYHSIADFEAEGLLQEEDQKAQPALDRLGHHYFLRISNLENVSNSVLFYDT
jgi:hypothetical protein